MKLMPNIKISEDEYQILRYAGEMETGGEAIICKSNRKDTLFKIFLGNEEDYPGIMNDNKFRKVLSQYNNPLQHSVAPLSTITLNGELIGYEMTYDEDDEILSSTIPRQELIEYLRQTKKILEYYDSKDIIYGDIKSNNILVNRKTHTAKFCDMDNIQLGEYPIDLIGYDLACFQNEHGSIDETTHAYFHNLLTLEQLTYPEKTFQSILYTLSRRTYPKKYQKSVRRILDTMVRAENFQGEYIVQYVKK